MQIGNARYITPLGSIFTQQMEESCPVMVIGIGLHISYAIDRLRHVSNVD